MEESERRSADELRRRADFEERLIVVENEMNEAKRWVGINPPPGDPEARRAKVAEVRESQAESSKWVYYLARLRLKYGQAATHPWSPVPPDPPPP